MSNVKLSQEVDLNDPDNPEWTAEDFARAVGPEHLSPAELAAFPKTLERLEQQGLVRQRGRPPLGMAKRLISMRLDPEVIEALRASGPGWQARANLMLKAALGLT
jgi:uncharacterized protein (DUF4415 family)